MPAPLRTFMVTVWVTCLAGAALILSLSLGYARPVDFAFAGLIGLTLGIPAGLLTARRVRQV